MFRAIAMGIAVAMCGSAVLAAPPATRPVPATAAPKPLDPATGINRASGLFESKDAEGAYRLMLETAITPEFGSLTADQRHRGWYLLGTSAMSTGRYREAHASFRQSSELSGAGPIDLVARATMASVIGDDLDAAVAIRLLAQRFPSSLNLVSDDRIQDVIAATRATPGGDDIRFDLTQSLIEARWRPADPFADRGDIWLSYVADLLARKEPKRAGVAALTIDTTDAVVALNTDKRFADVVQQDPAWFDVNNSLKRRLAGLKDASAALPRSLRPINAWASTLLRMGEAEKAMRLLDRTIARAKPDNGAPSAFDDTADYLATSLALRGKALSILGQQDEAIAALRSAAQLPDHGHMNVVQTAQLARLLLGAGKYTEAISTAATITDASLSAQARLSALMVQTCASYELGRPKDAAKALVELRERSLISPGQYQTALICAGDQTAAVDFWIQRLESSRTRAEALAEIQIYLVPIKLSDFDRRLQERTTAFLNDPRLKPVIAKYGSVKEQPLMTPNF